MAVEQARGCGFRKVGGLYLVGSGLGTHCDRLPITLDICPCCGAGIKATRGFTWVDIPTLVGGDHIVLVTGSLPVSKTRSIVFPDPCKCPKACPLCHNVAKMGRGGLLWIGVQFYPTIEHFEQEARTQGISRRIHTMPRDFKIGETWILFAHARGIIKPIDDLTSKYIPVIFRVWKPERIERIFKESQRGSEVVAAAEKRGITPVFVPDNDSDHCGSDEEPPADTKPPLF